MRTVEHDGNPYLLVKSAEDASLVRDPETGSEQYISNDELTMAGDSPLAVAASAVPEPQRRLLTALHSQPDLGLLIELDTHGPLSVRQILGRYDLCESDLHGRITELRAAGFVQEADIGGERGYRTTELATEALENLQ